MAFSARGVAAGLFVVMLAAICIRLGIWQLDRLEQRRASNEALAAGLSLPPLELSEAWIDSIIAHPERYHHRRVIARGRYEDAGTALLRGRSRGGRPGVELLQLLELEGAERSLLVNRGWIPAADAMTVDPRPYIAEGRRTVEGMLLPLPASGGDAAPVPASIDGISVPTLQRVSVSAYRVVSAAELLPIQLQRSAGAEAGAGAGQFPTPAPPPEFSDGPHLGYAVQWFSFAAIAVVGFLVLVLRSARDPRR